MRVNVQQRGIFYPRVQVRADQVVLVDNMLYAPMSWSWVKLHRARPSGSAVGSCDNVECGIVVHSVIT